MTQIQKTRLWLAAKKATATFIFASGGVLVGMNAVFDTDLAIWKQAASVGIGALINLVYRWSEAELKKT